jgi:hypothetical protein
VGDLVGLACGQPFAIGHLGRLRDHALEKRAQLPLGQHAEELVDRLAIHEGHHVGDAAHVEVRRQLRVLVRIDLGELPLAGVLGFELLQHRAQGAAGPAPRRPEIDQYRDLTRCFDHFVREVLRRDVAHRGASPGKNAAGNACQRGCRAFYLGRVCAFSHGQKICVRATVENRTIVRIPSGKNNRRFHGDMA